MFTIYSHKETLDLDLENLNPESFKSIQLPDNPEKVKKLIHDLKGGIRTFKYLGSQNLKTTPEGSHKEDKEAMISFYATQFESMVTLLEALLEKTSHESK